MTAAWVRAVPAPGLVLGSVICIQAGHASGKLMFGLVAPLGVAALRLGFAGLVLGALWRPRLPTDWRSYGRVVGFGTAIAGMHTIYPALQRLPLGAAVTIQFLGPLTVALAGSRRPRDAVWAILAGAGVVLFYAPGETSLAFDGVVLAAISGASWAVYIVLTRRLTVTADGTLLALAVAWAAALVLPIGILESGSELADGEVLLAGFGVAMLSAVVPWSLDWLALRRLPARVFGVLVSLEPALGGVAGLAVLGEFLTPAQWLAIGCVVVASMGVTWTARSTESTAPASSVSQDAAELVDHRPRVAPGRQGPRTDPDGDRAGREVVGDLVRLDPPARHQGH
jgi:threonine/homoserine efflux transporter RhtA